MLDEWEMARRKAQARREGKAEGRAEMASTMIKSLTDEGQSKAEVLDFLTRMFKLPQESAEQYYKQAMEEAVSATEAE